MNENNSVGMITREPERSRTEVVLDASIAVALACAGTYRCSNVNITEDDELDTRIEKICRAATEDTCDTKTWNEYLPRPLLDEEETAVSWESRAISILDDDRNLKEKPALIVCDVRTRDASEKVGKGIKEQVEVVFHKVPGEDTKEIKTLPLIPLLKKKLLKAVKKYNSNEGHRFKSSSTVKVARTDSGFEQRGCVKGERSVLRKVSVQMKSTGKVNSDPSNDGIMLTTSTREKSEKDSVMSSLKGFKRRQVGATLAGFEVNRVTTNHVSIIDRSLLLPDKTRSRDNEDVKPSIDAARGIIPCEIYDKEALTPLALNALSIRTFQANVFGDHLMMPSMHRSKHGNDKRNRLSLSPKPGSFSDVLNEGASQTTLPPQTTDENLELDRLNKTDESLPTEEEIQEWQLPNDIVNDDSTDLEIVYTMRAPYKMSRGIEDNG